MNTTAPTPRKTRLGMQGGVLAEAQEAPAPSLVLTASKEVRHAHPQ